MIKFILLLCLQHFVVGHLSTQWPTNPNDMNWNPYLMYLLLIFFVPLIVVGFVCAAAMWTYWFYKLAIRKFRARPATKYQPHVNSHALYTTYGIGTIILIAACAVGIGITITYFGNALYTFDEAPAKIDEFFVQSESLRSAVVTNKDELYSLFDNITVATSQLDAINGNIRNISLIANRTVSNTNTLTILLQQNAPFLVDAYRPTILNIRRQLTRVALQTARAYRAVEQTIRLFRRLLASSIVVIRSEVDEGTNMILQGLDSIRSFNQYSDDVNYALDGAKGGEIARFTVSIVVLIVTPLLFGIGGVALYKNWGWYLHVLVLITLCFLFWFWVFASLHLVPFIFYNDSCTHHEELINNTVTFHGLNNPSLALSLLNCTGDTTYLNAAGFSLDFFGITTSQTLRLRELLNSTSLNANLQFTSIETRLQALISANSNINNLLSELSILGNSEITFYAQQLQEAPNSALAELRDARQGVAQLKQTATGLIDQADNIIVQVEQDASKYTQCTQYGGFYRYVRDNVCGEWSAYMLTLMIVFIIISIAISTMACAVMANSQPFNKTQLLLRLPSNA